MANTSIGHQTDMYHDALFSVFLKSIELTDQQIRNQNLGSQVSKRGYG